MKALIVFDSAYGNTAEVARAIGDGLSDVYDTRLLTVGEATGESVDDLDLLVVGSPTQGGRATPRMQEYIREVPIPIGLRVVAFDTRFAMQDHGWGLRTVMKVLGFAADKMSRELVGKGGNLAEDPAGFIVKDKTGPLQAGELERAGDWAHGLATGQRATSMVHAYA